MKKEKLSVELQINMQGPSYLKMADGSKEEIIVRETYVLLIGYRTWYGRIKLTTLFTTEYYMEMLLFLKRIWGVKNLNPSILEKAIHTEEHPKTFKLNGKFRMRIIHNKPNSHV